MADAVLQTAEEQITCSICFEVFHEPKALPCLHTFCKQCIRQYIAERGSLQENPSGFSCPICRRFVKKPRQCARTPAAVANALENNHAISSMIDAYRTPRTKTCELCPEHEKELDFFCVDHTKFICSVCSLKHRKCGDVVTKEEARKLMASSGSSRMGNREKTSSDSVEERYNALLLEQCNKIEHIIDKRKCCTEEVEKQETDIRDRIINRRKKIIALLEKQEDRALTALTKSKSKLLSKIQTDINECELVGERIRETLTRVQKSAEKSKPMTFEDIQTEFRDLQITVLKKEGLNFNERVHFELNSVVDGFLEKFDTFGTIAIKDPTKTTATNNAHTSQSAETNLRIGKITRELKVQSNPAYQIKCNITGVGVFQNGHVLVADHTNSILQLFSSDFEPVYQFKLLSAPFDIAVITSDTALVTFTDLGEIRKCKLTGTGLLISDFIKPALAVRGIAVDGAYTSVCSLVEIVVYQPDKLIHKHKYQRTKFCYIALDAAAERVYVTDQKYPDPEVKCVSFEGVILWSISDKRLGFPTGLVLSGSTLLVASWDLNSMAKISLRGKFEGFIEFADDTVKAPWRLAKHTDDDCYMISQNKNTLTGEQKATILFLETK